jgi:3-oxoadipate enol-lactonase
MPRLAYTDAGSGGIPLVLLHGFPLDSRMWDAQVAELSRITSVIAPDFRGFGRSASTQDFTMESLADDVHEFLASIGALPCVLAGFSMGGYVALPYVKKYPSDVAALALIDTRALSDDEAGKLLRTDMIEAVRSQGSKPVADQMEMRAIDSRTIKRAPQLVNRLREIMESCPVPTIVRALVALRERPDMTPTLGEIRVPTLIIVGETDAITPVHMSQQMHEKIAGSRLEIIPEAGHMSPMEQPERVSLVLRAFLQRIFVR